ncbi:4-hydroxy-tetrahydrodipicolinate synthase [Candidatus Saccharibacteria bacterium]|nr:4-hydroxy-tetrahydrodipicolinate synthase [Candidatus Saccharibacteria bacterium]
MKKVIFKGAATAIVTPFTDDGVNYDAFEKLIEFQISSGIDALVVCGTTGESATMSDDEKRGVLKFAVEKVRGRVPVIAGTGGNNTAKSIELSQYAESIGVDGIMLVTPYYNKTTQARLVEHFSAIARGVKLPIIMYNVPSRTGMNMAPNTCIELAKVDNIIAVKEASGDFSQIAQIAQKCGDDLAIYSGNDDQILPVLSLGGIGVISVLSNVMPRETSRIVHEFLDGNVKEAANLQLEALPLTNALFCEVSPIPVKAALNMMGYEVGKPRLPLIELSAPGAEILKKEMKASGLI